MSEFITIENLLVGSAVKLYTKAADAGVGIEIDFPQLESTEFSEIAKVLRSTQQLASPEKVKAKHEELTVLVLETLPSTIECRSACNYIGQRLANASLVNENLPSNPKVAFDMAVSSEGELIYSAVVDSRIPLGTLDLDSLLGSNEFSLISFQDVNAEANSIGLGAYEIPDYSMDLLETIRSSAKILAKYHLVISESIGRMAAVYKKSEGFRDAPISTSEVKQLAQYIRKDMSNSAFDKLLTKIRSRNGADPEQETSFFYADTEYEIADGVIVPGNYIWAFKVGDSDAPEALSDKKGLTSKSVASNHAANNLANSKELNQMDKDLSPVVQYVEPELCETTVAILDSYILDADVSKKLVENGSTELILANITAIEDVVGSDNAQLVLKNSPDLVVSTESYMESYISELRSVSGLANGSFDDLVEEKTTYFSSVDSLKVLKQSLIPCGEKTDEVTVISNDAISQIYKALESDGYDHPNVAFSILSKCYLSGGSEVRQVDQVKNIVANDPACNQSDISRAFNKTMSQLQKYGVLEDISYSAKKAFSLGRIKEMNSPGVVGYIRSIQQC